MRGYWNRPDETEKVMFGDWLRTGDIGRMDAQGFVYIEDRKKDMILVSGFNVYPNEIESVLAAHPGRARDRGGGAGRRVLGRGGGGVRGQEGLRAHRRGADRAMRARNLTRYKVPKHVYFRTELPKTNVGKILRRALRDELKGGPTRA